jgi:hypothetical protein
MRQTYDECGHPSSGALAAFGEADGASFGGERVSCYPREGREADGIVDWIVAGALLVFIVLVLVVLKIRERRGQ